MLSRELEKDDKKMIESDLIWISYLKEIEFYELIQLNLSKNLKKGFLNLAKSKLILSPLKLSQANYDLSPTQSTFLM
jgi:hypothetical protein